jgi:FtsP/CotA-like multicopper oxidase with cupredoxin domain
MKRNTFLKNLGFGTIAVATSETILSSCMKNMDMSVTPQIIIDSEFKTALEIPETINGTTALTAQSGQDTLMSSAKVNVLGYRNGLLGPTIRVQKGTSVSIPFQNKMAEHTNLHWHGLVVPANMDGHPDQMVMPNESFNFQFAVNQQAGTNWYHPHLHQLTGKQVTQGLAGLFIVESPEEKALNLPSGNYEIPLIIQDKRFNTDGTIKYSPTMMEVMTGYMGDNILVNGTNKPYLEVATRFYRFRVLNGSSARIYNLAVSNGADFYVIGSDNGLLPQPEKVKNLMLGTGERADILIDFSTVKVGEMIYLTNETFSTMGTSQGTQAFKLMSFNATKQETDTFKMPTSLIPFNKLTGATKTRTFALTMVMNMSGGMHRINNKLFDSVRIDETVNFVATEIWEFDNSTGDEAHPMHVHGVQFQVVSRKNGRNTLLSYEKAWKDTVLVAPKEKVQVIMKFEQKGKFVFHCHNLEHEDDGMMLNFEVK